MSKNNFAIEKLTQEAAKVSLVKYTNWLHQGCDIRNFILKDQ